MAAIWWTVIPATILAVATGIYLYVTRSFSYWAKKGVEATKPVPSLGNLKDVLFQRKSPGELLREIYQSYPGVPFVGFYILNKPALLIRDPDLVKQVLIKDFAHFYDRYSDSDVKADPLLKSGLFLAKGNKWRQLRYHLRPVFSSGRLKKTFPLVVECSDDLKKHLAVVAEDCEPVEVKEITAKSFTDVITSCAFGLNSNCLSDPDAEFREFGRAIFDFTFRRSFEQMAIFFLPWFSKLAGLSFFPQQTNQFLRKVFWDTIVEREQSKTVRYDLIDQLIQLKNKGKMDDEDQDEDQETKMVKETPIKEKLTQKIFDFTGDDLVGQAAVFFVAGFETSSSTITFALYHLALAPAHQDRVRLEVSEVIERHGGRVTYEAVQQMNYLDHVVSETLRLYPTLPFLDRICGKDYVIPGTRIQVEKGTPIYVSVSGLQSDPDLFQDPEEFNPDRFSEEQQGSIVQCSYLPFGEGPRKCIGLRFAMLAIKTHLASILSEVEVLPCAETPIPLQFNPQGTLLALTRGIPLIFRRTNQKTGE